MASTNIATLFGKLPKEYAQDLQQGTSNPSISHLIAGVDLSYVGRVLNHIPIPLVDLTSEDPHAEETSDVLQQHYLRFQATLLSSVDRQIAGIQQKLTENDLVLKRTKEEKDEMGVTLYKARVEVNKANEQLNVISSISEKTSSQLKIMESERNATLRNLRAYEEENRRLKSELDETKKRLEENTSKVSHLGEINAAYTSDIKIHRRIEGKLKKELEFAEERRRQAETELEDQRKISEKLLQNKKELELILDAQKHETSMSTQAISKMNREINELADNKKQTEKQWEEALSAMAKRDQTFQSVFDARQKLKEELMNSENSKRVLKMEKEEAEKKLKDKELECTKLMDQVQILRTTVAQFDSKQKETRTALVESKLAESMAKQELEKISKYQDISKDEIERKAATISDLKFKLEKMKTDFDDKLRNETMRQVAKKEELVQLQAETAYNAICRDQEGKNIDLRHENAELKLSISKLQEQLKFMDEDRLLLQKQYTEINGHYTRLYDEAKHLMYDLERKEHDINYMKATIQELNEVDKTRPFQMAMLKLQKDLEAAKSDNDNIQNMWLESQKENLKSKDEINRLQNDNMFLRTQLGITDTVKIKTANEIAEAKSKELEQKMEASKLYNELRKLQPLVDSYRKKMLELEQQLAEARLKLQEEHVDAQNATNMLKTEIRRLYEDRRLHNKDRLTDERCTQAIERKYTLAREMVDKLKLERAELQKTCFELKSKADDMEKKYHEAQLQAKKIAEKASRTVSDISKRLMNGGGGSHVGNSSASDTCSNASNTGYQPSALATLAPIKLPPPVWASLATTPANVSRNPTEPPGTELAPSSNSVDGRTSVSSNRPSLKQPQPDLPDFESWRLKIESLTTERAYLLNENTLLKQKLAELTHKVSKLEKSLAETSGRLKASDRDVKSAQREAKVAVAKYARAEKVAASIEKQFKEAKPNTRINYAPISDVEPSTQLLAALMLRVVTKKGLNK
ncbi:hypothetical protein HDV05_004120 [Chytridiales sp. JEL 0842]|nr:hypothetical protein HDV05_004120 [Chytridiales sp. JEL 0842]